MERKRKATTNTEERPQKRARLEPSWDRVQALVLANKPAELDAYLVDQKETLEQHISQTALELERFGALDVLRKHNKLQLVVPENVSNLTPKSLDYLLSVLGNDSRHVWPLLVNSIETNRLDMVEYMLSVHPTATCEFDNPLECSGIIRCPSLAMLECLLAHRWTCNVVELFAPMINKAIFVDYMFLHLPEFGPAVVSGRAFECMLMSRRNLDGVGWPEMNKIVQRFLFYGFRPKRHHIARLSDLSTEEDPVSAEHAFEALLRAHLHGAERSFERFNDFIRLVTNCTLTRVVRLQLEHGLAYFAASNTAFSRMLENAVRTHVYLSRSRHVVLCMLQSYMSPQMAKHLLDFFATVSITYKTAPEVVSVLFQRLHPSPDDPFYTDWKQWLYTTLLPVVTRPSPRHPTLCKDCLNYVFSFL